MTGELVFTASGAWFWLGCGLAVTLLLLSLLSGKRQGWNARSLRLETLRLLAGALVLITLAKPEWWQALMPDEKPIVTILTDASGSMDTPDMPDQATRRAWLDTQRTLPLWEAIAEDFDLQWQPFESASSEQTDLHHALSTATTDGASPAAVILFSDGDSNAGESPLDAIGAYRAASIPLHTVAVGSLSALPDLAIEWLPIPQTVAMDEPMNVPFLLTNRFDEPQEVTVSLTIGETVIETKTILVAAGSTQRDRFVWKPDREGVLRCRLSIPEIAGEVRADNNQADASLTVRRDEIKVLLVESVPRWEFRYLRNALMRDPGVEVSTVLFQEEGMGMGQGPGYLPKFPATPQLLAAYDVIFLGDVGVSDSQLSRDDAEHLKGLVEHQSSGLVFVPGQHGHFLTLIDSPLEPLLPVALDASQPNGIGAPAPAELELTEAGRENVLTLLGDSSTNNAAIWRSLPGFYWHAPVERSKAGATVLAVHSASRNAHGRLPLLVTRPYGRGKTLFLGFDGAWRWRRGVEDKYHYRFWGQVARWMAYQRNLAEGERARLIHYPEPPKSGHEMQWQATVLGADLGPLTEDQVILEWQAEDDQGRITLAQEEAAWGTYVGSFTPPTAGSYAVTLRTSDGDVLNASVEVLPAGRETIGEPANAALLRELAERSGGEFVAPGSLDRLAQIMQALPAVAPTIQRTSLWQHPLWLAAILAVLTWFWIERKRAGLL